jgi:AcrR family transcriptional regulator
MTTLIKEQTEERGKRSRGRPRDEVARKRILDSALQLVEEVGCTNTTTDLIAERAGASKATIYRWWPNKAAVLMEALREQVAQEVPFPDSGNLREDIHRQVQNFVKLLTSRRGRIVKAFLAAAQSDPEVAEAYRRIWIQPRRAQARSVLEHHKERGTIAKNTNLDVILDTLYGAIYFRLLAEHAPLTVEFADSVAEVVVDGIERHNF